MYLNLWRIIARSQFGSKISGSNPNLAAKIKTWNESMKLNIMIYWQFPTVWDSLHRC